jgi:hypothetical protein
LFRKSSACAIDGWLPKKAKACEKVFTSPLKRKGEN